MIKIFLVAGALLALTGCEQLVSAAIQLATGQMSTAEPGKPQ